MKITRPRPIMSGAGETPNNSNGAAGRASVRPQFRRLLKPKLMRITATAERITPKASIFTAGFGTDGLSLKLRRSRTDA